MCGESAGLYVHLHTRDSSCVLSDLHACKFFIETCVGTVVPTKKKRKFKKNNFCLCGVCTFD